MKNSDKPNDNKETSSAFILRKARGIGYAFTYRDLGKRYAYGTLRNSMLGLIKCKKILKLDRENPTRFILPDWAHRPEYSSVRRSDKEGRVGRFDFLSYLESLSWDRVLGVHDLRLSFAVYQLHWLEPSWKYCKASMSYSRQLNLSCPVSVQCFNTGTVLVSVKCSPKPFPLDIKGLVALSNLLGEVRNALRAPCVPDPATWRVVQWHLNRDSEELQGGGLDVYLTFRDFFGDSAQFYYKSSLDKVRAEVNQSPRRTIQEVFENILNRDDIPQNGGSKTC